MPARQGRAQSSLSWSPSCGFSSLLVDPGFLIRGREHTHNPDQAHHDAREHHHHPRRRTVGDAEADERDYETQKRDGESDKRHLDSSRGLALRNIATDAAKATAASSSKMMFPP